MFTSGSIYFFCVLTTLLDRWLVITHQNMDHTHAPMPILSRVDVVRGALTNETGEKEIELY